MGYAIAGPFGLVAYGGTPISLSMPSTCYAGSPFRIQAFVNPSNPISGATVTFSIIQGNGGVLVSGSATSASGPGEADWTWQNPVAGTYTLKVVAEGAGADGWITQDLTVLSGPPAPATFTVTVTQTANGEVSPTTATYSSPQIISFVATPSSGYKLDHWTINGSTVMTTNGGNTPLTANPYTIRVSGNIAVQAIFIQGTPSPPTPPPTNWLNYLNWLTILGAGLTIFSRWKR